MTPPTCLFPQCVALWSLVHPYLFAPSCQCTPRHPNIELSHPTWTLVPSRRPFVALLLPWASPSRPPAPSLSPCRGRRASIDAVRQLDVGAHMSTFTHLLHSPAVIAVAPRTCMPPLALVTPSRVLASLFSLYLLHPFAFIQHAITTTRSRHPHTPPVIYDEATMLTRPSPAFGLAPAPPQPPRCPFPPAFPPLSPSTPHHPGPPMHPRPHVTLALALNAE